ncbi:hypothetical protein AAFF_G00059870 [Aldrovandia affinis]|uniref:Galectin n=1 Tax=Aldrovandia affinis TaxID=143900 RepID=A0AAD7S036_9TELE|nr:hypothetical protein AAFF_G00059870 [Aldrovandia affinis]
MGSGLMLVPGYKHLCLDPVPLTPESAGNVRNCPQLQIIWMGTICGQQAQTEAWRAQDNTPISRAGLDHNPANPTLPPGLDHSPIRPTRFPGLDHSRANQTHLPGQENHPIKLPLRPGLSNSPASPPGWPGQSPPYIPQQWPGPPSAAVTVPFNLDLPSGVYDKLIITINGQVNLNAKMFTVDFLRGKDIAFHINPRFNEGGKQVIVRNHKVGDRWGKEERATQARFPFMQGVPFEMKILCTPNEFKVAVNSVQVLEFKHRVRELGQIDRLSIYNDVALTSVKAETLP